MVRCKVCDVRDYDTARLCAELGVDYLGLHCIWEIKPDRERGLREIVRRLPATFPDVGLVLVTRQSSRDKVLEMSRVLSPSHIQLHSPEWSPEEVVSLRAATGGADGKAPRIVCVAKVPSDAYERVAELAEVADILVLDRTQYRAGERASRVEPSDYRNFVQWCESLEIPALIAGGLTVENVQEYLEVAKPWGVDVQSGVEVERGRKDPAKLRLFVDQVKSFGQDKRKRGDL